MCVFMCIDLMICNDTLHGVPLLLLANKQDLDVSCFVSLLPYLTLPLGRHLLAALC